MDFSAEMWRLMLAHAKGSSKKTFGYLFNELFHIPVANRLWPSVDWIKTSADHFDEVPYVFGAPFLTADQLLIKGKKSVFLKGFFTALAND